MKQAFMFTDAPAQRHSETSVAAAEAIKPDKESLRRHLLEWLQERGLTGATDEEAQDALGMDGNTERPRRRECEDAGLVRDSGTKRRTRSGREAVVWRAV